jgi:hypothetical protein
MSVKQLTIEILSGPLDGAKLILDSETEWTSKAGSLLSFPWDAELGSPQALFKPTTSGWQLEGTNAKRGTHILRHDTEDRLPVVLQVDDIVKASSTWMRIKNIS